MVTVGLLDSYAGMIILQRSVMGDFMYTNFFKAIPNTLIEAAKLDGATEMQSSTLPESFCRCANRLRR